MELEPKLGPDVSIMLCRAVAVSAVRKASRACLLVQSQMVGADALDKKDHSPVTLADFLAQVRA